MNIVEVSNIDGIAFLLNLPFLWKHLGLSGCVMEFDSSPSQFQTGHHIAYNAAPAAQPYGCYTLYIYVFAIQLVIPLLGYVLFRLEPETV